VSVSMILVGGLVIYVYGLQTNRYPYTSGTETWKWFYRDAIPDGDDIKLDKFAYYTSLRWAKSKAKVVSAYSNRLPEFSNMTKSLIDDAVNASQDIEQLFSLHLNEKYKNIYLSDIRTLFNCGLIGIAMMGLVGAGVGYYLAYKADQVHDYSVDAPNYRQVTSSRLLTTSLSKAVQVEIRVNIINNSKSQISLGKIEAVDKNTWPLPIEITPVNLPSLLYPNQPVVIFAQVKGDRPVVDRVANYIISEK
jgi:hypothetical protein